MSGSPATTRLWERGNHYFDGASATDHADEKSSRLHVAKSLYEEALQKASTGNDRASMHRSLSMTLMQLAAFTATGSRVRRQQLLQSVHHMSQAYFVGRDAHMSEAWLHATMDEIRKALSLLMEQQNAAVEDDNTKSFQVLQELAEMQAMTPAPIKDRIYLGRMKWTCHVLDVFRDYAAEKIATACADDDDEPQRAVETGVVGPDPATYAGCWKWCIELPAELSRPITEAIQAALDHDDAETVTELLRLEEELYLIECRARSRQMRWQGDQLVQQTMRRRSDRLNRQAAEVAQEQQRERESSSESRAAAAAAEAEACELEGLLSALDLLKSAALLARERDPQAEAQALSSLGHLYKVSAAILDPILLPRSASAGAAGAAAADDESLLSRSAEERSRAAFMRVLLLVDALPNKISLMMAGWYREARDSISEYQASRAAAEERQKEAVRAPVREELHAELNALTDAASKGWVELIKHCYDRHPPLNPANRLPPGAVFDAARGKELLRKAILAYHPDKQGAAGSTLSWKVLTEEITKQLTLKYEWFKQ